MHIPIFGNGDVNDPLSAKYFKETYGVDGLMIGRAVYGNPWIFREIKYYFATGELLPPAAIEERVRISLLHLNRSVDWKGERRGIMEIRKHWSAYFKGLPGFKPFRIRLMGAQTLAAITEILKEIERHFKGRTY